MFTQTLQCASPQEGNFSNKFCRVLIRTEKTYDFNIPCSEIITITVFFIPPCRICSKSCILDLVQYGLVNFFIVRAGENAAIQANLSLKRTSCFILNRRVLSTNYVCMLFSCVASNYRAYKTNMLTNSVFSSGLCFQRIYLHRMCFLLKLFLA